jgi:CheY-like chemotaxis protein
MPVMDGFEMARQIRKMPDAASLPLIAMTAHAMNEDRDRCLAAGMQDHLPTPIDPALLARRLVHWIRPDRLRAYRTETRTPTRPAATPSVTVTLPDELPGIDLADGLMRCGKDLRLYRNLLGQFHRLYNDSAVTMSTLCAEGKVTEARQLAHAVKGVAGNLGMIELASAAAALEVALSDS